MTRGELVAQARETIRHGSKSFAAASRLFDAGTRERVWLLYAWCRACDDLADDQELGGTLGDDAGAADRLAAIRALTATALAGRPTGDPSFDALGVVARGGPFVGRPSTAVIDTPPDYTARAEPGWARRHLIRSGG